MAEVLDELRSAGEFHWGRGAGGCRSSKEKSAAERRGGEGRREESTSEGASGQKKGSGGLRLGWELREGKQSEGKMSEPTL